jgi:histone deacetylase complex regulatory component SIN3
MRVLQQIIEKTNEVGPEQALRLRVTDTVHSLHVKAISRVYDQHGYDIIELLQRCPAKSAPVVLRRCASHASHASGLILCQPCSIRIGCSKRTTNGGECASR